MCPGGRIHGQITQKWPHEKNGGCEVLVAVRPPKFRDIGRKVAVSLTENKEFHLVAYLSDYLKNLALQIP